LMDKKVLYVMKNSLGVVKIGISNDPERRVKEIRLASGFKTDVIKTFETTLCAFKVEKALHKHFSHLRLEGEWFKKEVLETLDEIVDKIENPVPEYVYGGCWLQGEVYKIDKETRIAVDAPYLSTQRLDTYDTKEEAAQKLVETYENIIRDFKKKIENLKGGSYGIY